MSTLKLLTAVTEQILFGDRLTFSNVDINQLDSLLAARDLSEFDQKWVDAFGATQTRISEISDLELKAIDSIREASFKAAFRFSQNPELSGFVSDDFELIGRSLSLGLNDPWTNGLWMTYKYDQFPAGKVDNH